MGGPECFRSSLWEIKFGHCISFTLTLSAPQDITNVIKTRSSGLFWRDTLKVKKNFLGLEIPLSTFWQRLNFGETLSEDMEKVSRHNKPSPKCRKWHFWAKEVLCYQVELSNARINRFSDGFFPSTSHLWNSLPSAVFPASFNLPSFKRQVYHHLRDQMA